MNNLRGINYRLCRALNGIEKLPCECARGKSICVKCTIINEVKDALILTNTDIDNEKKANGSYIHVDTCNHGIKIGDYCSRCGTVKYGCMGQSKS